MCDFLPLFTTDFKDHKTFMKAPSLVPRSEGTEPYLLFSEQLPHHHVSGAGATDAHVFLLAQRLRGSIQLCLILLPPPFGSSRCRGYGLRGSGQHRVH